MSHTPSSTSVMATLQALSALVQSQGMFGTLRLLTRAHPGAVLLATNAGTAWLILWLATRKSGGVRRFLTKLLFSAVKALPGASGAIAAEQRKTVQKLEKMVVGKSLEGEIRYPEMPMQAMSYAEIESTMTRWSHKDAEKWNSGRVSGGVYHGGQELCDLMSKAYSMFCLANPLHPDLFPMIRKMEAEVVSMVVKLFHGGPNTCGAMSSGGTESILLACLAYRNYARAKKGIMEPEMVVPYSAHAAFDKAAGYFGIKIIHVPVDPVTCRVVPAAMEAAITSNTIMLAGSMPGFPHGVFDPIEELSALAVKHNIPLHVDCCLGSFVVAFMEKAGYQMPNFDFKLPGVTSISCDTHKYGFAAKGSSIIMYSSPEYRKYQYFVQSSWSGGIYASPTLAGSRPGGLVAACWAALMANGQEGYIRCVRTIIDAARVAGAGIPRIPGLRILGSVDASVVCFTSNESSLSIFNVGDAMTARGWNLNTLQNPPAVHLCVTYANAGHIEQFLTDLADAVQDVRTAPAGKFKDGMGAIYGLAESLPDRSVVNDLAESFLDVLYTA